MKRRLIAGAFLVALLPALASALSISELQAQIQALLTRISELRLQIQAQQGNDTSQPVPIGVMPIQAHPRFCDLYQRPLEVGANGDDVRALQEFLASEGVFNRTATGYYGPVTAEAVRTWQVREGVIMSDAVTAGGVFGPRSREFFMRRCVGDNARVFRAAPQSGNAPLTVTFYANVGGFRPASTRYEIDFGDGTRAPAPECSAPADACIKAGEISHTYATNGRYIATLIRYSDPCGGNPLCMAAVSAEQLGKVEISVGGQVACTLEYAPVCGAKPVVCITTPCNPVPTTYGNRCAMNADGASFLYQGECRNDNDPANDPQCKRWNDGYYCGKTCYRDTVGGAYNCAIPMCAYIDPIPAPGPARCLEYFTTSDNQAPTISSFTGPTTLRVGETGTWSIRASDPENGQLSYSVTWGDEGYLSPAQIGSSLDRSVVQTTTFTHSYARAGSYSVTMIVRDTAGKEARTTSTVRVDGTVGCYSGGVLLPEWTRRACINQGGVDSCLSDAGYVCRNGTWTIESTNPPVACTMDAMMCPDGSYVGRTGPNCQFVCPSSSGGWIY